MPKQPPHEPWTGARIRYELTKKGHTLASVTKLHGLNANAARQALIGKSSAGAIAISKVLGVPVRTLFPDMYVRNPARARVLEHDRHMRRRNATNVAEEQGAARRAVDEGARA